MKVDLTFTPGKDPGTLMRKIARFVGIVKTESPRLSRDGAGILVAQIKENASGRPGPNVISGEYRDSWYVAQGDHGDFLARSDHPAAWRLEKGYLGTDASGRVYHQPPFPHVKTAVEMVRPIVLENSKNKVEGWWK